jgi:hypothetical protein
MLVEGMPQTCKAAAGGLCQVLLNIFKENQQTPAGVSEL